MVSVKAGLKSERLPFGQPLLYSPRRHDLCFYFEPFSHVNRLSLRAENAVKKGIAA
jgi:hypothetical protein